MPSYYPMYPTLMSILCHETLYNMELVTWSELLVMYKTNKFPMSANPDTPVPYTTAKACRAMVLNPAPGSEAAHSNEVGHSLSPPTL